MRKSIIVCGDVHFRSRKPKKRIDDFLTTQILKLSQMLFYCENNNAPLIIAGDIFDTAVEPYWLCSMVANTIMSFKVDIFVVAGQHDLRFHTKGLKNTPLGLMLSSELMFLLEDKPDLIQDQVVYGKSWEDETPEPIEKGAILVTHEMVVENDKLFPGQSSHQYALSLLRRNPKYKLIISGDNHRPHIVKRKGQINLNCGSMMRSSKDQKDYKPCFYDVDVETMDIKKIPFEIEPFDIVFDLSMIDKEEEQKDRIDFSEYVKSIEIKNDNERPEFRTILKEVIEEAKANKRVKSIITNIMENIKNESC